MNHIYCGPNYCGPNYCGPKKNTAPLAQLSFAPAEAWPSWTEHLQTLRACRACAQVQGPPVAGTQARTVPPTQNPLAVGAGNPSTGVLTSAQQPSLMLIGQAPGVRERESGRLFDWRAGRTLFSWFAQLGVSEERFREQVYMAAVLRCFPGKSISQQGTAKGDRMPSAQEIVRCRPHLHIELALLRPQLILCVGLLAMRQFLPLRRLEEGVGGCFAFQAPGLRCAVLPLPHPSGVSRWTQSERGKMLLQRALKQLGGHSVWRRAFAGSSNAHSETL